MEDKSISTDAIKELKASKKYKTIHEDTIKRIVSKQNYTDKAIILKQAKKELYKIHTTFLTKINYKKTIKQLSDAKKEGVQAVIKKVREIVLNYDQRRIWLLDDKLYDKLWKIS